MWRKKDERASLENGDCNSVAVHIRRRDLIIPGNLREAAEAVVQPFLRYWGQRQGEGERGRAGGQVVGFGRRNGNT